MFHKLKTFLMGFTYDDLGDDLEDDFKILKVNEEEAHYRVLPKQSNKSETTTQQ